MIHYILLPLVIFLVLYIFYDNSADSFVESASRLFFEGKYEAAEKEIKRAFKKKFKKSSLEEAHTILGNIYLEMNLIDKAIEQHRKAIEINEKYDTAWVNLGIVYRCISEFDFAEECYMKAKELNPNSAEMYSSLSALVLHKGDIDKAIEYSKKALEIDPQFPVAHANYAIALAMNEQFELADKEVKQAVLLGYQNVQMLKQRIDDLKSLDSRSNEINLN